MLSSSTDNNNNNISSTRLTRGNNFIKMIEDRIAEEKNPVKKQRLEKSLESVKSSVEGLQKSLGVIQSSLERQKLGTFSIIARVNSVEDKRYYNRKTKTNATRYVFKLIPVFPFFTQADSTNTDMKVTDDYQTILFEDGSIDYLKPLYSAGYLDLCTFDPPVTRTGYVMVNGLRTNTFKGKNGKTYMNFNCESISKWEHDINSAVDEYFLLKQLYGNQNMPLRPIHHSFIPTYQEVEEYIFTNQLDCQPIQQNNNSSSSSSSSNNNNSNDVQKESMRAARKVKDQAMKSVLLASIGKGHPAYPYVSGNSKVFYHLSPTEHGSADFDKDEIISMDYPMWSSDITREKTKGFDDNYAKTHNGKAYQADEYIMLKVTQQGTILDMTGANPVKYLTTDTVIFHSNVVKALGIQYLPHATAILPDLLKNTPMMVEARVNITDTCLIGLNGSSPVYMPDGERQSGICLTANNLFADIVTGIRQTGFEITPKTAIYLIQSWLTKFGIKSNKPDLAKVNQLANLNPSSQKEANYLRMIVNDNSFKDNYPGDEITNCMEASDSVDYGSGEEHCSPDYRYYVLTDAPIRLEHAISCHNLYNERFGLEVVDDNKAKIKQLEVKLTKLTKNVSTAFENAVKNIQPKNSDRSFLLGFDPNNVFVVYRISKRFDDPSNHKDMTFDFRTNSKGLKDVPTSFEVYKTYEEKKKNISNSSQPNTSDTKVITNNNSIQKTKNQDKDSDYSSLDDRSDSDDDDDDEQNELSIPSMPPTPIIDDDKHDDNNNNSSGSDSNSDSRDKKRKITRSTKVTTLTSQSQKRSKRSRRK